MGFWLLEQPNPHDHRREGSPAAWMARHGGADVPGRQAGHVVLAHANPAQLSVPLPAGRRERRRGRARLPSSAMSLDFPAFELTEEHQELRAVVRALADDKIAPRAAEVDESG